MIDLEIDYDDCAVVFHTDGNIDVYCPDLAEGDAANQPNVQLLRGLLIALVKTVSSTDEIKELLNQIEQNMSPTSAASTKHLH